jgi:hypothetical protein
MATVANPAATAMTVRSMRNFLKAVLLAGVRRAPERPSGRMDNAKEDDPPEMFQRLCFRGKTSATTRQCRKYDTADSKE